MNRTGTFIRSFIPRHVSNRTFLRLYWLAALIHVSRRTSNINYEKNLLQLRSMNRELQNTGSAYIENQNEWSEIMYGAGSHHNMKYSGCEIIATYNALKAVGALVGCDAAESMAGLIRYYETNGAALLGEFGVSPKAIETYFVRQGFSVTATDKDDNKDIDAVDGKSRVLIVTVYNDMNDITKQVHTVCITKEAVTGYVLHNAYCRDEQGVYKESIPYTTLQEAISHISGYEPKLIYLIGIES